MFNCTDLDAAVTDAHALLRSGDAALVVALCLLVGLAGTLLIAGETLVRPLGAVVGGVGGAVAAFVLTALVDDMACGVRLAVAGVSGAVGALLALCVLRTGVFLLGAGGLATVTHFVYDALPLEGGALLGRSAYYYGAMAAAALVGGVLAHCQRRDVLRLASSLVGGGCLVLALHLGLDRAGEQLPTLATATLLVGAAIVGVSVQRLRARRARRARTSRDGEVTRA